MIVGITTTLNPDDGFERVNTEYIDCVFRAGAVPVLLPPVTPCAADSLRTAHTMLDGLDALILSGGGDIEPSIYGAARAWEQTSDVYPARDALELALAREAYARDMPCLGVCRGTQVVNVALGGTLAQDVRAAGLTDVCHRQEPPYTTATHRVLVERESLLERVFACDGDGANGANGTVGAMGTVQMQRRSIGTFQTERAAGARGIWNVPIEQSVPIEQATDSACPLRLDVNSMHHQAVGRVADALRVAARAEDGVIEAVEAPDRSFYLAVQWHPEYLPDHMPLFYALVAAAAAARDAKL
ncbi:MAG: gamma-glutamyl-gamma-aminobutyrate hydrolase family protein [Eggerthellaceae bacterium]|nr:gamma-glutamyl-gamma-aminobutyrate hydrolase family protein [Eggerthellaceae bacterium]